MFVYVDGCLTFSNEFIALLKVFAGNIAVGVENLALIESLDQLAYIDSVLGTPNRNAFEVQFNKHKRNHRNLVLVHVNSFSQASIVFGFPVIDKALLEIRRRLSAELDPSPYFIGYDGKADLILLTDARYTLVNNIQAIFESKIEVDEFVLPLTGTLSIVDVTDDMDAQSAPFDARSVGAEL